MSQQGTKAGAPSVGMGIPRPGPRLGRAWACAAVAIVLLLIVGIPLGYVVVQWTRTMRSVPGALKDFAADVVRPKFIVQEVVLSTVADVRRQRKLVVLQAQVNVDVTRQEGSSSWGVYWGTNTARVQVRDAKAQYYIDLTGIGTSDFVLDEARKVVVVSVPRPQLDTQMVSIDPAKIQTLDLSGGWMRWNKRETWEHAVGELVPKVLMEASRPLVRKEAEESGKEAMLGLMHPMVDTLGKNGMTLEIRYRD